MIKKYKLASPIKAEQFDESKSMIEKYDIKSVDLTDLYGVQAEGQAWRFFIDTKEGAAEIKLGNWIVTDDDGNYTLISNDVFKKVYVEDSDDEQNYQASDYYPNRITIEASDDISNNRISCYGKLSSADQAGLMMGAAIVLVARIGGNPEDTRKLFELLIEDDGIKGVFDEQKNDSK